MTRAEYNDPRMSDFEYSDSKDEYEGPRDEAYEMRLLHLQHTSCLKLSGVTASVI